jgi:hypothetical protein
MAFLYFDETIRERGGFIIGALVVSARDLSPIVANEWRRLGLDPGSNEYKSSDPKAGNQLGTAQRRVMARLLHDSRLGLVVAPVAGRQRLGEYCTELIVQLIETGAMPDGDHIVYLDESIPIAEADLNRLCERRVTPVPGSDSKTIGGIQVADHAAHALGGMLLEELGVLQKRVRAREDSGYHPDDLLDLGFELWASLRYALIGRNEYIDGRSPHPDDPANPFYRVEGVGLYLASTCSTELGERARARFGVNYLGCIH